MTRFVVLATQRSGSTWMIELLNSHPNVEAFGELFVEGGRGSPRRGADGMPFYEQWVQDGGRGPLDAYLDLVFADRPAIATGFKLMVGQAGAHPDLVPALSRRDVAVVHLVRRNALDILVSKHVALERGEFSADRDGADRHVSVHIPTHDLADRLRWQEREVGRGERLVADAGLRSLTVAYESMRAAPEAAGSVLRFLGVDPSIRLASSMRKVVTRPRAEIVENHDDVVRALRGTEFEHYLEPATVDRTQSGGSS